MSEYQDIECRSHTFTHTGSPAAPSFTISGAVRVFGFQWIAGSGVSGSGDAIKINLVNGTSYDASKILVAYEPSCGAYPNLDNFLDFPFGGILFQDGLFVRDEAASAGTPSAPEIGHISIFCQVG